MKDFDIFDHMDGIPDKESEKVRAQEVYKKVRNEFKKISKEDALGYSLQAVYIAHIIIDNECDCNEKVPPSYRLYCSRKKSLTYFNLFRRINDHVYSSNL